MRGKFITLEGMDGAGKSTHIPDIIKLLEGKGVEVISTREPGGTVLGEQLRTLLLNEPMHPETETLLMFAARREHIAQIIEPFGLPEKMVHLVLVNGSYVAPEDRMSKTLKEGDALAIWPPIAGG